MQIYSRGGCPCSYLVTGRRFCAFFRSSRFLHVRTLRVIAFSRAVKRSPDKAFRPNSAKFATPESRFVGALVAVHLWPITGHSPGRWQKMLEKSRHSAKIWKSFVESKKRLYLRDYLLDPFFLHQSGRSKFDEKGAGRGDVAG